MADIIHPKHQELGYRAAGNGGKGSFSYADTSVYGPRGSRVTVAVPVFGFLGYQTGSIPGAYIPGGGGGAKGNRKAELLRGAPPPQGSPHGIVLIRLTRVT